MNDESTAVVVPDKDMSGVKAVGKKMTAYQAEVNQIFRELHGMTWGSGNSLVSGNQFSKGMLSAFAKFCHITGANPLIHVDILGGKPYLNAVFWMDKLNTHERFHHHEQRDLSPSVEQALRERAERHRELAARMTEGDADAVKRLGMAIDLEDEADDLALDRAKWSPRETATVVVETRILRFINAAPMDAIRAGEITDLEPWLAWVPECNWAGGMGDTMKASKKWDPVGDANPGTTARTRSLKRCATKSFPAWMDGQKEQLDRAEAIIEAEWELVTADNEAERAANPPPTGPQAVTGTGEPSAAAIEDAEELPVEEVSSEPAEPPFDTDDARKRLFATLREAGITNDKDRKAWSKENGLPVSTKQWGREEYERVQELIVGPVRDSVIEQAGDGLGDLSLQVLGKREPEYLKDWKVLQGALEVRGAAEESGQEPLDL